MIIQFYANDVTFFEDDKAYFEAKLNEVKKFLGNQVGDNDTAKLDVTISKDKHHRGERFHGKTHLVSPHGGNFMAEADSESIKALADELKDLLERQARKFRTK